MSIFELFKERVLEVRKAVEEFKDDHKMASEAISLAIDSMPAPFNKFSSVIWNGLEKQAEAGADPSVKLLEILEKIENNTEQSFSEIKTNISEIIQFGAKTEDVQKLGEQIRISNESVIQNLKEAFNEELRKAAQRLEESFEESLTELRLLESNLSLVTIMTEFGVGSMDCWKIGYFRDEDIKSGYDARRPITDDAITSIDSNDNSTGTILYGKPYYGKSTILKRIMFEMIDKGYAVVFGDGIRAADAQLLIQLLNRVSDKFPKVLVIADNVHRRGSEVIFEAFNYFARKQNSEKIIKFLFGAREDEFKTAREALEREKAAEIDVALRTMHEIRISFSKEDAVLFLKKATTVVALPRETFEVVKTMLIPDLAEIGYKLTGGDPFMFVLGLMALISGKEIAAPMDFLARDLNEKISSLAEDERLLKAALLCSFMGMFGIPLITGVLESNHIYRNHLKSLAAKGFLFQDGEYKTRHELWILEFLIHIYNKDFDNDFASFDAMYNIKDMISSILNNIDSNYLVNILTRCAILYREERSKPIAKVIVDNYFVPDHLNSSNKAEIYCYGLGNFYWSIKQPGYNAPLSDKGLASDDLEYTKAIEYYDKAIELNPQYAGAWNAKGVALAYLGKSDEAIECYDKAIQINPQYVDAWNNKGNVFYNYLQRYDEALTCYDKAIEIDPKYVDAWNNKGNVFYNLRKYDDALKCYDKILEIDPNNANTWNNKGVALNNLGKYNEAVECYDKVVKIDPQYVDAWNNKGVALDKLGKYNEAVESHDKALQIDPKYVLAWNNKGHAFSGLGKFDEAIECFNKAIEIDPNYAVVWYNRARSKVKRGNVENGLEDLKTAIKIGKEECIRSAKEDEDFESIKNDERFKALLNL